MTTRNRRTPWIVLAVALVGGGLILALAGDREIGPSGHEMVNRYPELWKADADTVREIREQLPFPGVLKLEGHPVLAVMEAAGDDAPLALLRVMVERHAEHPEQVIFPVQSPLEAPFVPSLLMDWVAARRAPGLNAALVSIISDREGFIPLREQAVTAACWPGNEEVIAPLTAIALDEEEERDLRGLALLRLARLDCPLPAELRTLIPGRLTYPAAFALAKSGDESVYHVIREATQVLAEDRIALSALATLEMPPAAAPVSQGAGPLASEEAVSRSDPDLLETILELREVPPSAAMPSMPGSTAWCTRSRLRSAKSGIRNGPSPS